MSSRRQSDIEPGAGRAGLFLGVGLIGAGLCLGALAAQALPPGQDQARMLAHFTQRFGEIPLADYVYGSLMFDPEAMARHDAMLDFPPHASLLDAGERLWTRPFRDGKTYADCLPDAGLGLARSYPRYDLAQGRVITFEDALNDCRTRHGETPYDLLDSQTMGVLSAHARGLSDGMKMDIRVPDGPAMMAYLDGRRTFHARLGQHNYACASCHVLHAGDRLGAQILSPAPGQATHWPVFPAGQGPVTLQAQYLACFQRMGHVPDGPGSAMLNNLEYYHSALSNGLPMRAAVPRP